jgi:signal transduction histidine kinase
MEQVLARRIHDGVLQLVGTALLKTEMCEQLGQLGRYDEITPNLAELREALDETVTELRAIMRDLREIEGQAALKNRAV